MDVAQGACAQAAAQVEHTNRVEWVRARQSVGRCVSTFGHPSPPRPRAVLWFKFYAIFANPAALAFLVGDTSRMPREAPSSIEDGLA